MLGYFTNLISRVAKVNNCIGKNSPDVKYILEDEEAILVMSSACTKISHDVLVNIFVRSAIFLIVDFMRMGISSSH